MSDAAGLIHWRRSIISWTRRSRPRGSAVKIQDMSFVAQGDVAKLISAYGYWAVGVATALESIGFPLPGEAMLIAAAAIAGTSQDLNIWFVVGAAAAGAILGQSIGYWVGREVGFRLVLRYGRYIGLTAARIKLGQYLFLRHGGKVIFFGRFIAVLRVLAAFLAGINCMPSPRFLLFNAAGSAAWAAVYGFGAWFLGQEISRIAEPAAIALGVVALIAVIAGFVFLARHEARLQEEAEAALPGPLRRVRASSRPNRSE